MLSPPWRRPSLLVRNTAGVVPSRSELPLPSAERARKRQPETALRRASRTADRARSHAVRTAPGRVRVQWKRGRDRPERTVLGGDVTVTLSPMDTAWAGRIAHDHRARRRALSSGPVGAVASGV